MQGGASLSSGSLLQPLRNTIYDLIKLRRRLEIHADSQVCLRLATLQLPRPPEQACQAGHAVHLLEPSVAFLHSAELPEASMIVA